MRSASAAVGQFANLIHTKWATPRFKTPWPEVGLQGSSEYSPHSELHCWGLRDFAIPHHWHHVLWPGGLGEVRANNQPSASSHRHQSRAKSRNSHTRFI